METPILLSALYLILLAMQSKRKFAIYALLFSAVYCIATIELLSGINGLTVLFCLAICLFRMPHTDVSLLSVLLWGFLTAMTVFWLSTSEFIDGSAYSYAIIAAILALSCNVLFNKENRQTLCASAVLSAFAFILVSGKTLYLTDVAITLVITIALTQNFSKRKSVTLSRLT